MSHGTRAALIAMAFVTACGSQVPPEVFYGAQVAGTGAATGSSPGGSAPGSSAAALPSGTAAVPTAAGASSAAPSNGVAGVATSGRTNPAAQRVPSHTASQPASAAAPTSAACKPPTASTPTVVVCPSTGLRNGQSVHVYASGFQKAKPTVFTKALVVTECADKGNNTQQADCGALHFVDPDANGRVSITITVTKVVGSNKVVCGATYQCLVSVAQPKQPPDYEADQHISFA